MGNLLPLKVSTIVLKKLQKYKSTKSFYSAPLLPPPFLLTNFKKLVKTNA
jgi:hypothetical protein